MKKFKCISLYQPWAQLVVMGKKKFETRSWKTNHRGPLLIHAGLNPAFIKEMLAHDNFKRYIPSPNILYTGRIIGVVDLVDVFEANDVLEILGKNNDREEISFGNYERGRFAWQLKGAAMFDKPIPFRGYQRLFDVPAESIKEQFNAQLI